MGVLVLAVTAATVLVFPSKQPSEPARLPTASTSTGKSSSNAAESDMPFVELTIPYLRARSYQSELGAQTKYRETSTYTSYLTSYDSDGLRINGLLTVPKGQAPAGGWPAIVFVHGYIPPENYRTTEKYVEYVDYLARNGFVVFKIDLRGHGGSEGEANGAYYSSDYVIDTLNARAALAASNLVDSGAIGLWGHSMAGNVVLRALAARPEIPAAVIWAGAVYSYSDWQQYGLSDHSFVLTEERRSDRNAKRQALFAAHGEFDPANDFWHQVAATSYLSDLQGAIALHHAVDDSVVNIGYSRDLNALLNQTAEPHQLYEYPSGGHNISGSSFSLAMQRTVEFFDDHLKE